MKVLHCCIVSAMIGAFLLATTASAQLITIDPATGVIASSEISTCCADRDPADIVNGSGLVLGLHAITPGNMWLRTGSRFGGVDPDPFVVFDLGDVHTVNSFHVWNYNEAAAFSTRGVNDVSVEYGNTPGLGSTVGGVTNFAQAPGANGYAGENISGFPPFEARFIKFDIDTNHGDANTFYGLSEVQFDGETSGPERITGVTATATSELGGGFNRVVGNLVDNVGLDTTIPDGAPGAREGMWLNNGTFTTPNDLEPEVDFNLGAVENIGELHVYNYNEATNGLHTRGVNELEILVSNDDFVADIRSLGQFNLTQATGLAGLEPDIFNLGGVEAQYVRFDIASNHGGDNNFVGLNEVQFFRAAAVPEPASVAIWSLLALGLLGFGAYRAKRKK